MKYDLAHLNAMIRELIDKNKDGGVDIGVSELMKRMKPLYSTDNPLSPKFKIDEERK